MSKKVTVSNGLYRQSAFAHVSFLSAQYTRKLRSSRFCMPQTRARIYFVMVRKDVANHGQMQGLVHLVTTVLPSQLSSGEASISRILAYVKESSDAGVGPLAFLSRAKDSWILGAPVSVIL